MHMKFFAMIAGLALACGACGVANQMDPDAMADAPAADDADVPDAAALPQSQQLAAASGTVHGGGYTVDVIVGQGFSREAQP
jgi:hypothetical protein